MKLSEEQAKIVYNKCIHHTLILACPGSGKTTTMMHRILFMIQELKCNPMEFFIVTFTKNASTQIKERLGKLDSNLPDMMWGTFHSLARRILFEEGQLTQQDVFHVD